jgi:NADP-dependent 3-hydroxy acid dehydrogenase YdfG
VEVQQALVVGASSEIGAAVAVALAERAPRLVLWGRDQDRLDATASRCGETAVRTRQLDVTDHAQLVEGLAAVRAEGPLDVVVWAAGAFDWALADQADPGRWRALAEVNLTAPMVFTALVLPHLVAAAPSALVYIGSGAGHVAYPNNAAYVATKHGLTGLARATYLDVRRHGVKVSLVSPGMVAAGGSLLAPMTEEQRDALLRPDDVAAAVAFVLDFPDHGCPTEIQLQPHLLP